MPSQVCNGASLKCTFGLSPCMLSVLPVPRVRTSTQPAATIADHVPLVNIPPFGMCTSLLNPAVASATTAAAGVLTPVPCIPVTPAPWVPGSPNVLLGGILALDNTSTLMCTWGGAISIQFAGQLTHNIF